MRSVLIGVLHARNTLFTHYVLYIALHATLCTTLHYTTLNHITLRYTTLPTLHYTTLHYTTLHYTTQTPFNSTGPAMFSDTISSTASDFYNTTNTTVNGGSNTAYTSTGVVAEDDFASAYAYSSLPFMVSACSCVGF